MRASASIPLALALFACGTSPKPASPQEVSPKAERDAALASPAALAPKPPAAEAPKESAVFVELRDRWIAEFLADAPASGRHLGLHEWDGKVGDYSPQAYKQRLEAHKRWQNAFAAIDAAALSKDEQEDLALIQLREESVSFWQEEMRGWQKSPRTYGELFDVSDYTDRDYAPREQRLTKLVEHEEAALAQIHFVRENLELPLSKTIAEVARNSLRGYAEYLRGTVMTTFSGVGDKELAARFRKDTAALAAKADELAAWLEKDVIPHGDQSHVLGPERYAKLLHAQEGLSMPLAEFKAMNEENLRANRAAYDALMAEHVTLARPPSKVYLAEAAKAVETARQFVVAKGLVTLASDDTATVRETPPYDRWNSASIEMSGPFEKTRTAFFNVTLPDPKLPAKEQAEYIEPYAVIRTTAVHEVYPGHFVQGRWRDRAPTKIQKMLWSYSFSEGWAHYAEQMMLDAGYADTKENRLGQLRDALLRNCRFKASIGIHTEGMTVEQAAALFEHECMQTKPTAEEQARRGTFDPGYFAYTLGKLEILKLRDEAKAKLGARFTLRAFHDALLRHGECPIPLLHDRLLLELTQEADEASRGSHW